MEELAFRLLIIMRNPMYGNVGTSCVLERSGNGNLEEVGHLDDTSSIIRD